jgi:hypothetical protein
MWIAMVLVLGLFAPLQASVIVPGTANIWGAGHSSVPDGGSSLPPSITFALGGVSSVSFSSVTGTVNFGTQPMSIAPDGTSIPGWPGVNINGYAGGGISGIQFDGRQFFLMGVFLGPPEPSGDGPAKLVYSTASANGLVFSPLLAQVFFIGDGRGNGSLQQTFSVPAGATRLFFGFADGVPEFGSPEAPVNPGAYGDNTGSLSVNYSLNEVNRPLVHNPEPSTIVLMGLGIAALTLLRRHRA